MLLPRQPLCRLPIPAFGDRSAALGARDRPRAGTEAERGDRSECQGPGAVPENGLRTGGVVARGGI